MQSAILLQQTHMDILESKHEKCSIFLSNSSLEKNSNYCAMGQNSNMCVGDSGGPLMNFEEESARWTLLGIVSYVSGYFSKETNKYMCGQNMPSFYSSVPFYLSWIKKHL
jgi:secreted trypsin-like serine protease